MNGTVPYIKTCTHFITIMADRVNGSIASRCRSVFGLCCCVLLVAALDDEHVGSERLNNGFHYESTVPLQRLNQ